MNEFYWIAVVAVTIVSAARITRLLTVDKFPPVKYLREKYEDKADGTDWIWLTLCGYCMAPWVTALVFGSGLVIGVYDGGTTPIGDNSTWFLIWWITNSWFALSYLAAMTMAYDGDKSDA